MCHLVKDASYVGRWVTCVDRCVMCCHMYIMLVDRYVILHVVDFSSIGSNESLGQVFVELSNLDLDQGCRRTFALADLASSFIVFLFVSFVIYMIYYILCH